MKEQGPLQEADWDSRLNALIDGELDADGEAELMAAVAGEAELQRMLEQARQLQQAIRQLPVERAPRSLLDKLGQIEREHTGRRAPFLHWWQWGAVAAAVPLLLMLSLGEKPAAPSPAEIDQGRQDLRIALAYLEKAGQKAALHIDSSIETGVVGSITGNTVQALKSPVPTEEELPL